MSAEGTGTPASAEPAGIAEATNLSRASRRALGCVAVLNIAYAAAAASPYAIACLPSDAGARSFATAAGVILLEVFAVSLPGYLLGLGLWRARRRRAAVAGCLAWLVLAEFLLRIDAIMFPLFRQHVYGALAFGCLLQGDADALAMTPAQMALYALEVGAVVGLQAPAYLLIRRQFLRRGPERSSPWVRPTVAAAGGALLLLALGAWAASRTGARRAELTGMQRGLLVPLALDPGPPPPREIAEAAARGFRRALAEPAGEPAWLAPVEFTAGPEQRPNIVMIFAESLRADALTPEGAPEMWRFARENTRALRHYSNGNTTYLALFSAAYGHDPMAWNLAFRKKAVPPPLAALKQAGYRLHLASGCSMHWWNLDELVLPRPMFDSYFQRKGDPVADDLATVREAERVIDSAGGEPFFLFVFLYATHWSYYFPPECARFEPWIRDLDRKIGSGLAGLHGQVHNRYRNAGLFVDRSAGQIVRRLEDRHLLGNTVVVFTGDHGESFFETGSFIHGNTLDGQELAAPLAVHWPGAAPREIAGFTRHEDIFPSIFKYMGLASPQLAALSGRPHLLEGPGGGSVQVGAAAGAADRGSPQRWLLLDERRRLTILLPEGAPELVAESWREASGPEGAPVKGAPDGAEAEGVESRVYEWLKRAGAAGLWRSARKK